MRTASVTSIRKAALAGIVGALITAIAGAFVQLSIQPNTEVSDEMWSYPWTSAALVPTSLLYAVAHLLVAIGLVGLWRSRVAGGSRAAGVGIALAAGGSVLMTAAEIASIPIREARIDDTSAGVVGALFGLSTLLVAIGLLMAGRATLAAGRWHGWRRITVIGTGIWTLAMVGIAATKALPMGVAIFGVGLLAIAVALYTEPVASQATDRSGVLVEA